MKIISFPHYTCGGLLSDILNQTFSKLGTNGGINSIHHSIGKIGDSASVYTDFDTNEFKQALKNHTDNSWIGTHCWMGKMDLKIFDQVINITTMTYRSKLYRWVRAYHHYYLKSEPWQGLVGMSGIDKQRETAKNYIIPFEKIINNRVINIEFADIVECTRNFVSIIPGDYQQHLDRWKKVNYFLYSPDLWSSPAANRFHEAEHEILLDQDFKYV
jgi:hypothetical protein